MAITELDERSGRLKKSEGKRARGESRARTWVVSLSVVGVILIFFVFQYLQFQRGVRRVGRTMAEYLTENPAAVDVLLALSIEEEDRWSEARKAYHRAVAGLSHDPQLELLLQESLGAQADADWEVIRGTNDMALAQSPNDPRLNLQVGLYDVRAGRPESARPRFEFYLKNAPASDLLRQAIARAFKNARPAGAEKVPSAPQPGEAAAPAPEGAVAESEPIAAGVAPAEAPAQAVEPAQQ